MANGTPHPDRARVLAWMAANNVGIPAGRNVVGCGNSASVVVCRTKL